MPEHEDPGSSEWAQRIDRLLSGTTVEQVRELIDDVRGRLDRISETFGEHASAMSGATTEVGSSLALIRTEFESMRGQLGTLANRVGAVEALRDDLVRSLEAVVARDEGPDIAGAIRVEVERVVGPLSEKLDRVAATLTERVPEEGVGDEVRAQTERILGGFAQRVGQLQTQINEVRDELVQRVGSMEPPPAEPVDAAAIGRAAAERIDAAAIGRAAAEQMDASSIGRVVVDAVTEKLSELEVAIRTDVDALARQRVEEDTKQADALGLRVTNMSMSVNNALDGVREQVEAMAATARRLEGEQAAILEAIREQVSGIGSAVGEQVEDRTQRVAGDVASSVAALGEEMRERLAAIEAPMQRAGDAAASLADLGAKLDAITSSTERLATLDEVLQRLDALRSTVAEASTEDARLDALAGLEDRLAAKTAEVLGPVEGMEDRLAAKTAEALGGLNGMEQRLADVVRGSLASVADATSALADLPDVAMRVGAIPQIEEQLARVEGALGALAGIGERVESLGGIEQKLGTLDELAALVARIRDDAAVIPTMREQLRELAASEGAGAVQQALAAVDQQLASMDARVGGIAGQLEVIDQLRAGMGALDTIGPRVADAVGERMDAVGTVMRGIMERIEPLGDAMGRAATSDELRGLGISDLRDRLEELSQRMPDDQAIGRRIDEGAAASADRLGEIARAVEARVDEMARAVEERVDAVRQVAADLPATIAEVGAEAQRATAGLAESAGRVERTVSSLAEGHEQSFSRIAARLDGVEGAVARVILEVREALDGVKEATGVETVTQSLTDLGSQVAGIGEATRSLRAHLASMPGPPEVATLVSRELSGTLDGLRSSGEGRLQGLERELSSVASNVNEIWMRVRELAQTTDSLGESVRGQGELLERGAAETGERIERMAGSEERVLKAMGQLDRRTEERLARAIAQLGAHMLEANRAVEAERDRVFLDAFEIVVDRIAQADRTLGKRLRGLFRGKRAPDREAKQAPAEPEDAASRPEPEQVAAADVIDAPRADDTSPQPTVKPKAAKPRAKRSTTKKSGAKKKTTRKKTTATRAPTKANKAPTRAKKASAKKKTSARSKAADRASSTAGDGEGTEPARAVARARTSTRSATSARDGDATPEPPEPSDAPSNDASGVDAQTSGTGA